VHGLLLGQGDEGFGIFEIGLVGVPIAAAGLIYILVVSRHVLPSHQDALTLLENPREYTVELVVDPKGPLSGKTLGQAGLDSLPGLYVAEIRRRGRILTPVGPDDVLEGADQLVLVGNVDAAVDAQKVAGLRPLATDELELDVPRSRRWFVEAVVSDLCPLVGRSIGAGKFRTRYDAVVIGVARAGARIPGSIADIVLRPGDVLLIEAHPGFVQRHRLSHDFYLVSRIEGEQPPAHERAGAATAIVLAMVATVAFGVFTMLQASLLAAGTMLLAGCLTEETARRRIDWPLLIAIAAAFGLGHALQITGAAASIALVLLEPIGDNPLLALALVYLLTTVLTELITNNAAAVLMFYLAMATAEGLGVSFMPFAIAVAVAASASFATPIGYQTNLMVYGAGGYRFLDFVKLGAPLNLLSGAMTVLLAPLIWPF
jgi:di/tricarboxylate transporter